MKKKILWITGLLIASGVVIAQVPNTFSPGDSLSSSKLNQNFTYLTKLVKDGAGNTLGQLIGATSNEIDVMTSTGYHYGITTNVATGPTAFISSTRYLPQRFPLIFLKQIVPPPHYLVVYHFSTVFQDWFSWI